MAGGAIIESESNTNGTYVKFADGTMICTNIVYLTNQTIAPGHPVYWTSQWTPPSAFYGEYYPIIVGAAAVDVQNTSISMGYIYGSGISILWNCGGGEADDIPGNLIRNGAAKYIYNATIKLMAIGRWKA